MALKNTSNTVNVLKFRTLSLSFLKLNVGYKDWNSQNAFVEIDYEIISTVILLPSAESFKKDCCQLQVKVCA